MVPETDLAHYEEIIHRDRKEEKGMWIYNCWTDEVERRGRRRETTWGNLFRGVAVRQCLPSIFDGKQEQRTSIFTSFSALGADSASQDPCDTSWMKPDSRTFSLFANTHIG